MKGLVCPCSRMDSVGSKSIDFLGSTFSKKNFSAPCPILSESASISSAERPSIFPHSIVFLLCPVQISSHKSSAATPGPPPHFILPQRQPPKPNRRRPHLSAQ